MIYSLKKRLFMARGFAAALLLGFALAGPAAHAGDELQPVKILDPRWSWPNGYELVDVADAQGFFKKHGLKVEWISVPLDQYTTALSAGITDFAPYADYAYFINVKDKGLDVREVVASSLLINPDAAGDGLFVPESSPIKSAAELKGKKVGMEGLSWSSAWFTLDYLGKQGVTKEDVAYVAVPQSQLENVLLSGDIDAAYFFPPGDAVLRKKGGFRQLFALSDLSGRKIVRGGSMAKNSLIEEKPELVRGYVAAIAEAADWANAHPAEVIKLGIERKRIEPEIAPYVYTNDGKGDYSVLRWAEHGVQNPEDIAFWLDLVERQGVVPKGKFNVDELYTDAFNPYAAAKAN